MNGKDTENAFQEILKQTLRPAFQSGLKFLATDRRWSIYIRAFNAQTRGQYGLWFFLWGTKIFIQD